MTGVSYCGMISLAAVLSSMACIASGNLAAASLLWLAALVLGMIGRQAPTYAGLGEAGCVLCGLEFIGMIFMFGISLYIAALFFAIFFRIGLSFV